MNLLRTLPQRLLLLALKHNYIYSAAGSNSLLLNILFSFVARLKPTTISLKQTLQSQQTIKPTTQSTPLQPLICDSHQSNDHQIPSPEFLNKKEKQYLAIDCEMVGVGPNGHKSALARVSIVDFHGTVLLDSYVKSRERVTHYRTWVSGIKPEHLVDADSFQTVNKKVAKLIENKILIGHAIDNDLEVLSLTHPPLMIRDTSTYRPLQKMAQTKHPSLRRLASLLLGLNIQKDAHCSIVDARATMAIYRTQQNEWEEKIMKQTCSISWNPLLDPQQYEHKETKTCNNLEN